MRLSGIAYLVPALQGILDPASHPSHTSLPSSNSSSSSSIGQSGASNCSKIGIAGFGDASNFTLAAYSQKLSPDNSTGVPLALGFAGAVSGAEFKILSTWQSAHSNQWPQFSLTDGHLSAHGPGVNDAEAGSPLSGGDFIFVTPPQQGSVPDRSFCGLASISEHGGNPVLAVDGHVDLFSLCPESNKTDSQIILRFNATAENSVSQEFDNEGCEPVTVYMLY